MEAASMWHLQGAAARRSSGDEKRILPLCAVFNSPDWSGISGQGQNSSHSCIRSGNKGLWTWSGSVCSSPRSLPVLGPTWRPGCRIPSDHSEIPFSRFSLLNDAVFRGLRPKRQRRRVQMMPADEYRPTERSTPADKDPYLHDNL